MKYALILSILLLSSKTYSQTWQDVGGGTNNSSHGMVTWNGKLINLGSFNNPCQRVAEWDGVSWNCLGGGVGIVARAATVWDGKLVVVGDFWNNFQPCVGCNGVAVWDGVSWSPLGNGVNNDVLTCTVWNNELVIGGDFTQADGVPVARIIKWNGAVWESVGPIGSFDNDIRCMTEFEGDLWVGGDFNNVGGQGPLDGLVKYDEVAANWVGGNSGVDLIGGVNESVRVLYVNPNDGNLYMGGEFPELWDGDAPAQDFNMSGIAMYDGSNWTPLGTGLNEYCRAMHEYNGDIVAGGYFTTAGGVPANKIAKWDGTTWTAMGLGFDAIGIDEYVKSAAVWNGIFFAGGAYTQAEGGPMNYIAQWYEAPTAPPVAWMSTSTTQLCGSGCVQFLDNSTNAPTSWNWSFPGSTTPTSTAQDPGQICYTTPGTYTATLQACNGFGCTTQNVDIEVTSGATVTSNDESICGGGPVILTATPSVAGGTFLWTSTSETTASISVNPAVTTTYTVTYSYLGCVSNSVSTVTVGVGPSVTVNANSPSICEGETTTLTAVPDVAGGTYLWSPGGETTASINVSPLSTTDYTCEYTLNGCASTPVISTITVNAAPTVSVADEAICGGGSATLTAMPAVGGGTYLWSPGGQTTASITESPGATTSYSVVYTLNGCPSASESATINVGTTPTLAVNDETICEGDMVTLTPTPSAGGGTYLWTPTSETTATIDVSPTSTTSYDVVYTLNGCPSNTETINVTVNPAPIVSTNNPTICEGESILLTATPAVGGGTYLWTPGGQTTPSITVSPTVSTDYSVEYTLNGCTSTPTVSSVTVNAAPTLSVADEAICGGGSATLTAVPAIGGGTYLWSPGGQTTASITESPGATTSYSVVYTLNGCPSTSESATINVGTTPTLAVNDETICEGEVVTLMPTPSAGGGTYLWTPTSETTATIDVSPTSTSSYDVVYTLNGCPSNTETINVTVNPAPIVSTNNPTICEGESILLTATPAVGGGTYLWTPGGQTTQSITVSPTVSTDYSVEYTVNGCTSTPTISSVTVNAAPTVSVADEAICGGGSATLTAVPAIGGGTYLWSPGGQTTASITESPGATTSYSVVYTLNGCPSASVSALINVGTTPTLAVNDETICEGEMVTLTPTPSIGGGTYLWTPTSETTATIDVSPTSTTSYDVVYTLNGCPSNTETITVNVNPTPSVSANSTTICDGESTTLTATPGTVGGTYLWTPGNETTPSITVSPSTSTDYTVEYTLNGCTSTPEVGSVTVNPVPTVTLNDIDLCDIASGGTLDATASLTGGAYLWSPGGETTPSISVPATSGTYSVVYTLNGCPSTSESATVNILTGPNVAVTEINNEITADQNNATYQWLDCNNGNAIIAGETGQTFIPTINGSYAVQVDLTGCIDTSACTVISTIGIDEINAFNITVYPNPTAGLIQISDLNETNLNYEVLDLMGKVVLEGKLGSENVIDISALANGTYTLEINDKIKTRIVKQ